MFANAWGSRVQYGAGDPLNGNMGHSHSKRFLNREGQEFNRVSNKDIGPWKG
jgi:hypothetical protein